MYEHILYAVEGPTAIITLNRPDRLNAWTGLMGLEVKHALATAEADQEVVGIVITGAGRAFCAGADMGTLQEISSDGAKKETTDPVLEAANPGDPDMDEGFRQQLSYLMSVRKPIIAAVNGPCVGMAAVLSLNCDMRFVAEKAFFMMAFSQRGLVAEWGSCWMLPRLVGVDAALDMLLSSRRIYGEEALRIRLATRVCPGEELLSEAKAYIQTLADGCAPQSMAIMKRQVYEDLTVSLGESLDKTFLLMQESFDHPDFNEGVQAFVEKRPPNFARIEIKNT